MLDRRGSEQTHRVSANGEEGDIAQVKQARKTDHDVETETHHDEDADDVQHFGEIDAKNPGQEEHENGEESHQETVALFLFIRQGNAAGLVAGSAARFPPW